MKDNKTRTTIKVLVSVCVLLLVLTASYAFMTSIVNNLSDEEEENISTASANNLKLVYTDCASTKESDCADITGSLTPGGTITKTFSITNESSRDLPFTLYFQELYNTFLNNELVYTIENMDTNETLKLNGVVPYFSHLTLNTVALESTIGANTTYDYKMTITFLDKDYDQNYNDEARFSIKLSLEKGELSSSSKTLAALGLTANRDNPDFSTVATTDEGVYAMEDDYGTSYYFRGAVENNYVYFAGFYWRIIRINGDGSIRMIYDGQEAYANGTSDAGRFALTVAWNTNNLDPKFVGWMFGGTNEESSTSYEQATTNTTDSEIKRTVDTWYKTNIMDAGYSEYVSDEIFCNDRSISSGVGYYSGSPTTYYSASTRLSSSNASPIFTCPQKNDAFTVSDTTNGNGALTYPVGLITADEIVAAGGSWSSSNSSYYLYNGEPYWTLTPYGFNGSNAYVLATSLTGYLSNPDISNTFAVAPVINLSADYAQTMSGSGSMTDPFTIE